MESRQGCAGRVIVGTQSTTLGFLSSLMEMGEAPLRGPLLRYTVAQMPRPIRVVWISRRVANWVAPKSVEDACALVA